MELTRLEIPDRKIKQLEKAGITCVEDLLETYPRKYLDRSRCTGLLQGQESVFMFCSESIRFHSGKASLVKLVGREVETGMPVHILWFNAEYVYNSLKDMIGQTFLVAGNATYVPAQYNDPNHYEVANPPIFTLEVEDALGIYPVYRKIPGMSEDYYRMCVSKAAELLGRPEENLPDYILMSNRLMSYADMVAELHWPSSWAMLEEAQKRKLWNDLLYFALRIELNYLGTAVGSPFNLPLLRTTMAVQKALPFQLTADQASTLEQALATIRSGKRLNALIQGDVGCGKTILAILLMVAFAENGYQAAFMAPTQILAWQHYTELTRLLAPYGFKTAFVSGQKMRKADQDLLEKGIAEGEYQLIVGTQALLSDTYQFKNLALVIEDEEHKYGVMQRKALTDKAANGTHTITMSATPIPRTLAQVLYGDNVQLFSIHSKPAGRLPVRTGIPSSMDKVIQFLLGEIGKRGHQAYVVCPMVAPSEKVEGVATAEETYENYRRVLEPYGISVGLVTGKTKKADAAQILQDFADNKISLLVSTTVIEVGVNVPNATCMIVHNAERFGLAQLHQLRGRVVRGSAQGWCILISSETQNERLKALCEHTDGFEIAEIDLQLRGGGDLLGSQQSGTERYLALALHYKEEYTQAQEAARWILSSGEECRILDLAMYDHQNRVGGEMLT